jgi:hypothetical protein
MSLFTTIISSDRVNSMLLTMPLLSLAIRPHTYNLYSKAAAQFILWYQKQPDAYSSLSHIDSYLSVYLNLLFQSQTATFGHANNTVFGLMHIVPALRSSLPTTRRCLKGWRKSRVTLSWPPMSWELCCMLAIQMSSVGWYDEAFALLITYDGYFRINELLNSKLRHFFYYGLSTPPLYQFRLKETKTGVNKLVTLTRIDLGAALMSYIRTRYDGRSQSHLIFNFTASQYRKRFKIACEMLNWESVGFVPHSVRHGHASDDFNAGVPIETIQVRGRWATIQSTRNYIQSGRVHLIRGRLTPILPFLPNYESKFVLELMQKAYLQSLPQ